jgi:hypothetical protein
MSAVYIPVPHNPPCQPEVIFTQSQNHATVAVTGFIPGQYNSDSSSNRFHCAHARPRLSPVTDLEGLAPAPAVHGVE